MAALKHSDKQQLEKIYGPLIHWEGYKEDWEIAADEECRYCGRKGLDYVALHQDHRRTHTVETRTGRYVAATVCPECGDVGVF